METHDLIGSSDELAAYEHRGHGGAAPEHGERLLDLAAPRDLVQLVHRRVDPEIHE